MPFDETTPPTMPEPEQDTMAEIPEHAEQLGNTAVSEAEVHMPVDEPTALERENSGEFVGNVVTFRIDREALRKNSSADEIFIAERIASLPERIEFRPGIQLLVGPNGSGKSTLLSAMYYLAEEQYLGGKPELSDREVMDKTYFRREVAEAIHLEPGSRFDVAIYFDGAESDPFVKQAARREADNGSDRERHMFSKMFGAQRKESSRESKDAVFDELSVLLRRLHADDKRAFLFIDEFENGLDPRRHLRVRKILEELVGPEDTAIIATNSPVLFSEDLPRLDFTFPEGGMHGPQESMNVPTEEVEKRLDYYRFTKDVERYIRRMSRTFRKPEEWTDKQRGRFAPLLASHAFESAMKYRGVNCRIAPLEGSAQKLPALNEGELDLFDINLERVEPFARDRIDRYFSVGKVFARVDAEGKRKVGTRLNPTEEIEAGFQEAAQRTS